MKTEFLDALVDEERSVARAAELLRAGEIVAFPTETVYGLGARIFSDDAVRKIFEAKNRPYDNPMIVHLSSAEDVNRVARETPSEFYRLAERFSPGPLTVVLRRHFHVPSRVSAGLETVAVRVPDHPLARRLILKTGEPLVAPSANRSGRPSPTTARHVMEDLDGRIAAVLEGGKCRVGIESTVISLTEKGPKLLRPGIVTSEEISMILNATVEGVDGRRKGCEGSPGLKHRHYAPQAKMRLVKSMMELQEALGGKDPEEGCRVFVTKIPIGGKQERYGELGEKTFYAELRKADEDGVREIMVVCDEAIRARTGLMDRIRRAAGMGEGECENI